MRILAFTDLHARKDAINDVMKKVKDADIIVGGGDFSDWGKDTEKILDKFKDCGKQVIVVHGNHESEALMHEIEKKHKHILFLHKRSYQIDKYVFFGYGGGGFAKEDGGFDKVVDKFAKTVRKEDTIIIVTHGPPYGTKLDKLTNVGYAGSKSYRKFLDEKKPVLWICGHIHENFGNMDVIDNTVVVNPGPDGRIIEI